MQDTVDRKDDRTECRQQGKSPSLSPFPKRHTIHKPQPKHTHRKARQRETKTENTQISQNKPHNTQNNTPQHTSPKKQPPPSPSPLISPKKNIQLQKEPETNDPDETSTSSHFPHHKKNFRVLLVPPSPARKTYKNVKINTHTLPPRRT